MIATQNIYRTGSDGSLTLPLGQPNAEFEVLVVVQLKPAVNYLSPHPAIDPWAGAKAIHARLATSGRIFNDSVELTREDRDR